MNRFKSLLAVTLFLAAGTSARAQFWKAGTEKPTKWMTIENNTYRLIYPVGTDSLARVYLDELERFRIANGRSSGFRPGELNWGKIPVVIHPYTATSNGMAAWAPKGMHFYAAPRYLLSEPTPWETQLAVHESRHISQMQFGQKGIGKYIFGEAWQGAMLGIYTGQPLMEGDAVTAETALTSGGRGRSADFLNYMRVALDNGDYRNYYRWVYGSYRHYTPDFYKIGYMTVSGMRYFYDDATFMKRYYDNVNRRPLRFGNFQKTVKQASGKSFKATFSDMMGSYAAMWKEEADARAPYTAAERVSRETSFYTDFVVVDIVGDDLYAVSTGLLDPPSLGIVRPDGSFKRLCSVSSLTGTFNSDRAGRRLYFSEECRSPRFELSGYSLIRYYDLQDRKMHDLCSNKERFYNPMPSLDGKMLSVTEYPVTGGSAIVLMNTVDGKAERRFPAPEGIQFTESAWYGDRLYAIGISKSGYGLYSIDPWQETSWACVSEPSVKTMYRISSAEDGIMFVSDRDGEKELYRYSPEKDRFYQKTSTRHGIEGFAFSADGSTLLFNMPTYNGKAVYRTSVANLSEKEVSMADVHIWKVAEKTAAQELALAGSDGLFPVTDYSVSTPRRYRQLSHLVKFHSWVPLYIDNDDVRGFSMEVKDNDAALGLTGFFQNDLSTFYGSAAYHVHEDNGKLRHAAHLKFTYAGWTPVIEGSVNFNERRSLQFYRRAYDSGGQSVPQTFFKYNDSPFAEGKIKVYIPYSFNKGGIRKGLVPSISFSATNDCFDYSIAHITNSGNADNVVKTYRLSGIDKGKNIMMTSLSASMRAFVMQPVAPSQTFPRLGIGIEGGFAMKPRLTNVFSSNAYLYMYGYLPGLVKQQGIKLTATGQKLFKKQYSLIDEHTKILPRGYDNIVSYYLYNKSDTQVRLTADYAVPFYLGDISFLSPVFYATHFTLMPFFDITLLKGGNILSAGASLTLKTKNIGWFPFDGELGFRVAGKGGSYYKDLNENGVAKGRMSVEMIYSMNIF